MSDIKFKSSLSLEEIDDNFKNIDFFSGIIEGLTEALAYEKGKASAQTYSRKSSLPVVDVMKIRKSLCMTQKSFANILGVSPRTVEAWESGKSNPTPTARKLMYLIEQDNSIVENLM